MGQSISHLNVTDLRIKRNWVEFATPVALATAFINESALRSYFATDLTASNMQFLVPR